MKAVIYARVSKDRRQLERSVDEQVAECREFCTAQGWEVASVHVDNDRSASRYSTKDRPAWDVLMGELSRYDVLVTWEASRATRNLEVYAELRRRCRDEGVLWAYSGRVYDLSRSDDAFMTGLEMLTAERSSDDTAKRIQRTVRSQAKAGKPHGRIPFGYAREYDPTTGALVRQVPHETEAPLIREMARRVLDGESLYSIAKDLSQRDVPRMRLNPWDTVRIKRVLTNPTIAGKRVYRGEVIGDADWEGIITPEESLAGITPHTICGKGPIGLVSKSGTLTYQMMYELRDFGFSTAIGIGGDPIIGTTHIDALEAFEADPDTQAIVMIGEIGGDAEERAAEFIKANVTKPVVGYVAGFTAPEGKTMGHAGAIVSGSAGTAQAKKEALEAAGVKVGKTPSETAQLMREILQAQA